MNITELAKECGALELRRAGTLQEGTQCFTPDQLTAFANAIVEECAKVADPYTHGQWFANEIRALKVKG